MVRGIYDDACSQVIRPLFICSGTCRLHVAHRENLKHLLNLIDQLSLDVTGCVVGIFLNRVLHIIVHGITIKGVWGPDVRIGETVKMIWQPRLTLSGRVARS